MYVIWHAPELGEASSAKQFWTVPSIILVWKAIWSMCSIDCLQQLSFLWYLLYATIHQCIGFPVSLIFFLFIPALAISNFLVFKFLNSFLLSPESYYEIFQKQSCKIWHLRGKPLKVYFSFLSCSLLQKNHNNKNLQSKFRNNPRRGGGGEGRRRRKKRETIPLGLQFLKTESTNFSTILILTSEDP